MSLPIMRRLSAPTVETIIALHITRVDEEMLRREITNAHPTMTEEEVTASVTLATRTSAELMASALPAVHAMMKQKLVAAEETGFNAHAQALDENAAADSMRYVTGVPKSVAEGHVLVHNDVACATDQAHGTSDFRAWTQLPSDDVVICLCGWSGLPHSRVL